MDTGRDTNIPDARSKDWLNASKTNSLPSNAQMMASQSSVKEMDSAMDSKSIQSCINLGEKFLLKEIFKVSPSQSSAMVLFFWFARTYRSQN